MSVLTTVPYPPTEKQRQEYYGDAFIKKYLDEFEAHCWNHPIYGQLSIHLLLGQLPNINDMKIYYRSHAIDTRVHVTYISPSGTGKGAGANFISKIARDMGLKTVSIENATDAGLVGSVTLGYDYDPKTKQTIREPKYEAGLLSEEFGLNLLIYTEAGVLFTGRTSSFAQYGLDYLQKAMNPMDTEDNTISKKSGIGDFVIEIHPTLSLLLTTYEPKNLYDVLVDRGLLQRMAFYVNRVSISDYSKNSDKQIQNLLTQDENDDTQYIEIIQTFKNINEHYKGLTTIGITDDARDGFISIKNRMYKYIDKIGDPDKKQAMIKFLPRQLELAFKFAYHHALMRLSDKIEMEDIVYSKTLSMKLWKNVTAFLEEKMAVKNMGSTSKRKRFLIIQSIVSEVKKPTWRNVMSALESKMAITPETANNFLEEALEAGYIKIVNKKVVVGKEIRGV